MRTSISLTLLSVLIVVSLQPSEAMAHAKTDVITVDNGDQLTGAIDSMTAGKLSLDTDYAGTIKIKWRDVHQIDSRYLYEVRLEDGERIYGRFSPSEIAGDLIFYSGGRQRTLPTLDVVEIRSIEEQLADQLDFSLSTTFIADPNSLKLQLQAKADYNVRGGRTGFDARFEEIKTKNTDSEGNSIKETTKNSKLTLYREFWRDRGKATGQSYRVLNAIYSSNEALGVDHRGSIGVGVGRYFIQALGHELRMSAGIQGVRETRASCDEQVAPEETEVASTPGNSGLVTCNDAELFVNLQWHLYRFSDRDMDISLVGNAYPSLTDTKRVRGDLNLALNWEIFDNFFWTITARTEVDTAGTQDNKLLSKSDYSINTGVTWKY